jgi:hypothetical protein
MNQNFQPAISLNRCSMYYGIRSWLVVTALEDSHEVLATSMASFIGVRLNDPRRGNDQVLVRSVGCFCLVPT